MTNNGSQAFQMSSGVSFTKEELERAGTKIQDHTEIIEKIQQGSGGLHVPFPHFGLIGAGVHGIHEKAIRTQEEALKSALDALKTWQPALSEADKNYKVADDLPDLPTDPGGLPGGLPGAGDLGGMKPPNLPGGGLPGSGDLDLPKPPDGDLPGGDLPGGDLPGGDLPGGDLPGGDLPGGDLPGSDLPGGDTPDLPNPNVPGTDLPQPNVPTTDPADTRVPDIDSALNDPSKTDLSQFQPTTPSVNGNLPSVDPSGLGSRTGVPATFGGPGGGSGGGVGIGPNGGLPGGTAALARGVSGVPGAGGMPMMPFMPMGAGAGGDQNRDREKTVGLSEDESVWMGDEDIAPQVIGQEEL